MRFIRLYTQEKVLDGRFDEKLGLDAEPAADFLPQIDAESLQLAAFFKHKGLDHARGHAHADRRSLAQTSRRNQQQEQRPDNAAHGFATFLDRIAYRVIEITHAIGNRRTGDPNSLT